MRCTAATVTCLALGALHCAGIYGQAVDLRSLPFDPTARAPIVGDRETHREEMLESATKIRGLVARKLRGEDICSEDLGHHERQVVCTPKGVFKWADAEFDPSSGCRRCAGY